VTVLRTSRAGDGVSAAPQALQKRAPSGFSPPQLGHMLTAQAYDRGA
jgi:hypothetical protein